MLKKILKNKKGMNLIEVLVALALLGIIAVGFLSAISTAAKASFLSERQAIAENLARSQLENAKEQPYQAAETPDSEVEYGAITEDYSNFSIWSVNRAGGVVEQIIGVPWDTAANTASTDDNDIQKIKIVIKHQDEEIYSLEGYKIDDSQTME